MPQAWILAGATATGKTAAAQALAEQTGCAVLSADAMLVYRGMDIGTAKPTTDERGGVPYFGIDLVAPDTAFNTGLWMEDAARALRAAHADAASPGLIVVGGTGLYIKALTDGIDSGAADPAARARWQVLFEREGADALRRALAERAPDALASLADPSNPRRLIRALEHLDARGSLPTHWKTHAVSAPIVVLRLPREQLHARIAHRVDAMLQNGLVEEVRALRRAYPVWSPTASQAIGYAEVCALLDGAFTEREAAERIVVRTRQLAKRQETWFRHQANAVWLEIDERDAPGHVASRVLELWRRHGPTNVLSP